MIHKGGALSNKISVLIRRDSEKLLLFHFMHMHWGKARQGHSKKSACQEEFSPETESASLQNYEKINLYCLLISSLWHSVMAAWAY